MPCSATASSTWSSTTSSRSRSAITTSGRSPTRSGPTACSSCRCRRSPDVAAVARAERRSRSCSSTSTRRRSRPCRASSATTSPAARLPRGICWSSGIARSGSSATPSQTRSDSPRAAIASAGFTRELATAGVSIPPDWVGHGAHGRYEARDLARRMLTERGPADGDLRRQRHAGARRDRGRPASPASTSPTTSRSSATTTSRPPTTSGSRRSASSSSSPAGAGPRSSWPRSSTGPSEPPVVS